MSDTPAAISRTHRAVAILVSPGAAEGYPPVLNQARLLADAGFAVELVTVPSAWAKGFEAFQYPGVRGHAVSVGIFGRNHSKVMIARMAAKLASVRARHFGRPVVEIAFDPLGVLISDMVPLRPRIRVAHFHELLANFETHVLERRLAKALRGYWRVVVADEMRADLLADQVPLANRATVVPNYPMRCDLDGLPSSGLHGSFQVIYAGSLGAQQQIDVVVRSVALWPQHVTLALLGDHDRPFVRELKAYTQVQGLAERVRFEGWIAYADLPARLSRADLGTHLLDPKFEQWRSALGASNKRYQYMQAGLPQIGDQNPGVPEMLEGQSIGYCVREQTPEAIAEIVTAYANDPARRLAEGHRARTLHLERYNYETAFAPMVAALCDALAAP